MEWKKCKLGEVCRKIGSGATPSGGKEEYKGGNYSLVRSQNVLDFGFNYDGLAKINDQQAKKLDNVALEDNDVLLNITGDSVARACLVPSNILPARVNQHVAIIRADKSKADSHFLLYSLQANKKRMLSMASGGATRNALTKGMLDNFELLLPPLPIQRRIAAILSSLDAQIENNNRINHNLEAQAQALFKSWFVDFAPWGGVMPEGWKEGKLGEIAQLLNGFAFKSDSFIEDGKYQLITIKGVQDGALTTDGAVKINDIPSKMPTWCLLEKGDILLSLTGNVGRCCYVDRDNLLLNQRVAKIQPLQEYNRMFVYTLFRTETMKSRLISLSRGTAQANLSPIETSHLEILIPSKEVLKCFGEKSNSILNQMINNTEANARLASLRDTLLPKLMKGEIDV